MKNHYTAPLMEMKMFENENIVTIVSGTEVTNVDTVTDTLKTQMSEKVDTAIENNVFTYSTGW